MSRKSIAQLEKTAPGHYQLTGDLSFDSVPELWEQNKAILFEDDSSTLDINLSRLERSDSSGLAILLEWYREAEQSNKKITFINIPQQMYDIARVSGLDEILPLTQEQTQEQVPAL